MYRPNWSGCQHVIADVMKAHADRSPLRCRDPLRRAWRRCSSSPRGGHPRDRERLGAAGRAPRGDAAGDCLRQPRQRGLDGHTGSVHDRAARRRRRGAPRSSRHRAQRPLWRIAWRDDLPRVRTPACRTRRAPRSRLHARRLRARRSAAQGDGPLVCDADRGLGRADARAGAAGVRPRRGCIAAGALHRKEVARHPGPRGLPGADRRRAEPRHAGPGSVRSGHQLWALQGTPTGSSPAQTATLSRSGPRRELARSQGRGAPVLPRAARAHRRDLGGLPRHR